MVELGIEKFASRNAVWPLRYVTVTLLAVIPGAVVPAALLPVLLPVLLPLLLPILLPALSSTGNELIKLWLLAVLSTG